MSDRGEILRDPVKDRVPHPEDYEPSGWGGLALVIALIVALGMWTSASVVAIVLALVVFIFLHELGHYLVAKAAGMKVTEFFIGFGPRLWSFRRGETTYGLKAIPAGAYVRIIGMSNLEDIDASDEDRTYRQKTYPWRVAVAVAGSAMHFVIATLLIFTVFVGFGSPQPDGDRWSVGDVSQEGDSPAREAGVEVGDRILAIDGRSFDSFQDLSTYVRARPGESVTLRVQRDGGELELSTTLAERQAEGQTIGFLGVGPLLDRVRLGPVEGAVDAVGETAETAWLSVRGLVSVFSPSGVSGYLDTLTDRGGDGGPQVATPDDNRLISVVGAVQIASQSNGVAQALRFLFFINVFIGIFNLVPLLPFDGGHIAIATYERIRSRRGKRHFADIRKLLPLTYAVVAVLTFIAVSTVYLDLVDPISLR